MIYTSSIINIIKNELLTSIIILAFLLFFHYIDPEYFLLSIILIVTLLPIIYKLIFYYFWGIRKVEIFGDSIFIELPNNVRIDLNKDKINLIIPISYGIKIITNDGIYRFFEKSIVKQERINIEEKLYNLRNNIVKEIDNEEQFVFNPKYSKKLLIVSTLILLAIIFAFITTLNSDKPFSESVYVLFMLLISFILFIIFFAYFLPYKIVLSHNLKIKRYLFGEKSISLNQIFDITHQAIYSKDGKLVIKDMDNGYILAEQISLKLESAGLYDQLITHEKAIKETLHSKCAIITFVVYLLSIPIFYFLEIYLSKGWYLAFLISIYIIVYFILKVKVRFTKTE